MTAGESRYADLLLEWSRTIPEHRLSWEEWLLKRYRQTGGNR